jgi:flagellar FliJ protein
VKKFQFRLEKLKKLKEDRKKESQRRLAQAKKQESEERSRLETLKTEVSLRRVKDRSRRLRRVEPENLRRTSEYMGQLGFLIRHQSMVVERQSEETGKRRKELEESSREVKKYERLKDIKRDQYIHDLNLALQKDTDEVAIRMKRKNPESE